MGIGNIFKSMGKAKLPDAKALTEIPKDLKTSWKNAELNQITVRYFNHNFSKVIEVNGVINRDLAIPIIYIKSPHPAGIIMFDDSSYTDVVTGETKIDVCESYAYTFDKRVSLMFDFDSQYYNDIANGAIDKKVSEKLREKTGLGYYMPVHLNGIPIPVIKTEQDINLTFLGKDTIKSITYITQALLIQLSKSKMFARTTEPDNSGLAYAFLLGASIFSLISSLLTMYLLKV